MLTDYDIYNLRKNNAFLNNMYENVTDDGKILIPSTNDENESAALSYQEYYAADGHKMNQNEIRGYILAEYAFSANYVKLIANALGLKTYIKIRDFKNTQLQNYLNNYITYIELLQNAYSWSSSIPQRQINVFIRGDTLYVIQRGLEDNVFDITDTPHSRPTIERKLLRTTWEKEIVKVKWSKDELEESTNNTPKPEEDSEDDDYDDSDDDSDSDEDDVSEDDEDIDDDPTPYTGIISYSSPDGTVSMSIEYEYGLIVRDQKTITMTNSDGKLITTKSDTTYTYDHYRPKVQGTPSTNPQNKKTNNSIKEQKPTVYTNEKSFEKAMEQWQKQKTQAERQYQRQLTKLRLQRQKELEQLHGQCKAIWFVTSQDSIVTTTTETYKTEIDTSKINRYDGIGDSTYLFEECELTTTITYTRGSDGSGWEQDDEEHSMRQTFHTPVGNGYYAHSQYLDGEFQTASLSQGKPFQQVSQFTSDQIQKSWNKSNENSNEPGGELESPDIGPAPIFDPNVENNKNPNPAGNNNNNDKPKKYTYTYEVDINSSFPTDDAAVAQELEAALEWLNRKIQEEATVEIYGKVKNGIPEVQHIVDFTETVKLDGNIYYLESNKIRLTPTRLSQQLKLVRWY